MPLFWTMLPGWTLRLFGGALWDVDARFYDMKFTIEEREDNKIERWALDVGCWMSMRPLMRRCWVLLVLCVGGREDFSWYGCT
jgi:hypothetical protein